MNGTIDDTIEGVERLYSTLSGRPPSPNGPRIPIPPEVDPGVHVQDQLERLVSAVEWLVPRSSAQAPVWSPCAVVWIHENDLVLSIDVPGVVARDLQVRLEPRAIVVSGQRRVPWTQPPRNVAACEAQLGTFVRPFPLGDRVAPEQISARLDDGVLTIRVHSSMHTKREPSQIVITS